MLPVHDGLILRHDDGLHDNSLAVLSDCFSTDTLQDCSSKLPAHTLIVNDHAIVPDNCYETQRMLGDFGLDIIPVDMTYFQSIGLGPRALTLPVFQ